PDAERGKTVAKQGPWPCWRSALGAMRHTGFERSCSVLKLPPKTQGSSRRASGHARARRESRGGLLDSVAVWNAAQARIREELGWLRTRPWLEDLGLRSLDRGLAWLEASSAAERSATQEHREAIEAALG